MPRVGLTVARVIEVAVTLVDQEGRPALSMARLAERLGVRTPSLYKHVAGLDAIEEGVALAAVQGLLNTMVQAAVGRAGDSAIRAIAQAYRQYALDHPGLYALTLRAPSPPDAALAAAGQDIVRLMQTLLHPFGLNEADTIHAIRALRSLVHGFVALEQAQGFGLATSIDTSFDYLVERFIAGLRPSTGDRPATSSSLRPSA